jgi:uncharacterized phosphosugar-binding protein
MKKWKINQYAKACAQLISVRAVFGTRALVFVDGHKYLLAMDIVGGGWAPVASVCAEVPFL